ncbi:MAG TPA: phosphoenolpyruvate carboxykinase, partial [Gammaproteobacteria bacterium]|nr:phosphoenolpyruvate carboxykinase [Gammaproteobacteria bacterium]
MTSNKALADWVAEVARHTEAEHIHWCDGSAAEYQALIAAMLKSGTLLELEQKDFPRCYLH